MIKYNKSIIQSGVDEDEVTLLCLAQEGEAPYKTPGKIELETLLESINKREVKIHFPWFWTHKINNDFTQKYASRVDIDSLHYIILKIESLSMNRDLHWMEKTNLFHLYGLCRVIKAEVPKNSWVNNYHPKTHLALSTLSASNSMLIQKGAEAAGAVRSINLINEFNIQRAFSEYQLYYYGGFDALLSSLGPYLSSSKVSVIPTSLYAISKTFLFSHDVRDRLHAELIDELPINARKLIGDINAFKR